VYRGLLQVKLETGQLVLSQVF